MVLCVHFFSLEFAGVGLSTVHIFVGVAKFLGLVFPSSTYYRAGFVERFWLNLDLQ